VSIGQELAAARSRAGLTVEQVSQSTRIRQTIINAIEADDFSRSGGDFYARAHIRGIAQAVHLDPAALLAEFDTTADRTPSASAVFESETAARAERRGPNWSAAMVAALALVVVYGGFQYFTGDSGDRQTQTIAGTLEPRGPETPGATPQASQQPTPDATPRDDAIAQVPRDRVTVALEVSDGKSWVSVTNAAGRTLFSGLLDEGDEKSWSDRKRLKMTIGNAGAVSLVVNGKKVGPPGSAGEVARVQFTPEDPDNA
jgi:cytoskeleton protein RodZ